MSRPVRPSARAVLVEENRVLLNHLRHESVGDFFELPGGGIRPGETLRQAVARETREETGYSVEVHELLWARDYIAANHEFAHISPPGLHAVDLLFRCTLAGPAVAEPHEIDNHQIGVEWIEVARLAEVRLHPLAIVPALQAFLADRTVLRPIYLGDVS
ncbi:MAG: NUDIX domain-containing protein [Acidimicrobiia bacterium]|nr:NUDIX domain-containing protein [Acidimicrobiia bacterium]NNJ46978.1 NUDIX domain-containing protein [Acidimicrobiia bacterium]